MQYDFVLLVRLTKRLYHSKQNCGENFIISKINFLHVNRKIELLKTRSNTDAKSLYFYTTVPISTAICELKLFRLVKTKN